LDGAVIHYTTDGSTPSETSATYTQGTPIPISSTTTLKAIAVGADNSGVQTWVYTIDSAAPGPVTAVDGNIVGGNAYLWWTNPSDADLYAVTISYDGMTTPAIAYRTSEGMPNYAVVPNVGAATRFTLAAIDAAGNTSENVDKTLTPVDLTPYLAGITTGGGDGSAASPKTLVVGRVALDQTFLAALLNRVLADTGKYYKLDLSACGVDTNNQYSLWPSTSDGGNAFVQELILPDTLTQVYIYGTTPFSALKTVSGAGVTSISSGFSGCTNLTSVNFPKLRQVYGFDGCTALTSVSFPEAYSVAMSAFQGCTALTSVSFPKAYSVGQGAFQGCIALTSASFQGTASSYSTATIGANAFSGCAELTSISFPKATSIGAGAFADCAKLSGAEFPKATSIAGGAFSGCTLFTNIKLGATPPALSGTGAVFSGMSTVKFRVPTAIRALYDVWIGFNSTHLPTTVTYTFEEYTGRAAEEI
jgi:hypothetical protein